MCLCKPPSHRRGRLTEVCCHCSVSLDRCSTRPRLRSGVSASTQILINLEPCAKNKSTCPFWGCCNSNSGFGRGAMLWAAGRKVKNTSYCYLQVGEKTHFLREPRFLCLSALQAKKQRAKTSVTTRSLSATVCLSHYCMFAL